MFCIVIVLFCSFDFSFKVIFSCEWCTLSQFTIFIFCKKHGKFKSWLHLPQVCLTLPEDLSLHLIFVFKVIFICLCCAFSFFTVSLFWKYSFWDSFDIRIRKPYYPDWLLSKTHLLHLRGDKTSMLTHAYPHIPRGRLKWPSAITNLTAHFTCCLMAALVMCKHDSEMSLLRPGVIEQSNL